MKRSRWIWLVAGIGIVVLLAGLMVSGRSRSASPSVGSMQSRAPQTAHEFAAAATASSSGASNAAPAAEAALDSAASKPVADSAASTEQQQGLSRLVVKTANIALEVDSVANAETAVRAKANQLGGYIVEVQTSGADEQLASSITFRVPANRFDEALSGVEALANKTLSRTVGGSDVTEEYVDLDSRLRNLEATRTRLLTFLDKADKVEDALAVNQSLTDVQGQIEQIQGRKKYLEQSAAFSTITVALSPVPTVQLVADEGWQPLRVARNALRGLIAFGQGIAEILIVLLVWSPVWGVLVVLGLVAWRRWLGPKRGSSAPGTA